MTASHTDKRRRRPALGEGRGQQNPTAWVQPSSTVSGETLHQFPPLCAGLQVVPTSEDHVRTKRGTILKVLLVAWRLKLSSRKKAITGPGGAGTKSVGPEGAGAWAEFRAGA